MEINSRCKANPKNAFIKKTVDGESPDYITLKTIKSADTSTIEGIKIKNNAIIELKERYQAVIEGSKRKLEHMASGHTTVLDSDVLKNYEYDCYEHFMMAVNGIDLNRVQHMKGSYSFYIQLVRYLAAFNRKIINRYCGGTPKETPLKVFRPAKTTDLKMVKLYIDGKEKNFVAVKNTESLYNGYVIQNTNKELVKFNPDFTYNRDKLGRLINITDTDGDVVLKNISTGIRKLDAYNTRSEWSKGEDGDDISIFDTSKAGYTTVESQLEHKSESQILQEAIKNAYSKFNDIQKHIWLVRMDQSAEQYEKRIAENKKVDGCVSRPKFEDIGRKCSVSSMSVKENMKAMRTIVSLEIEAVNRKYNTNIKF